MMIQLNPPLTLFVPERDDYMLAWFVTDYHMEENLYWTGPMRKTGEIWTLDNTKVRADKNFTLGRTLNGNPKDIR